MEKMTKCKRSNKYEFARCPNIFTHFCSVGLICTCEEVDGVWFFFLCGACVVLVFNFEEVQILKQKSMHF